jgi:hypothetical protein
MESIDRKNGAFKLDTPPMSFTPHAVVLCDLQVSLSRLNHRLPRGQAHPEIMEGTTEFHEQIANTRLPQADPVFHHATALDTAVHMLDAQPTLAERLVGPLLLSRQLLAPGVSWWA